MKSPMSCQGALAMILVACAGDGAMADPQDNRAPAPENERVSEPTETESKSNGEDEMTRPPPGKKKYLKQGGTTQMGGQRMTITGFSTNADGTLVASLQAIGSETVQEVSQGSEIQVGSTRYRVTEIDRPEGEKGVVWFEKVDS